MITTDDRALREGIPVTSLARTLLDLAATVRFEWLEKMIERSEDLGLFDLREVEDLLTRTVGHHGHGRLRKAIALYKPTSFTRSSLEKRFLELCLEAGLPQPRTNYVEEGFELDCWAALVAHGVKPNLRTNLWRLPGGVRAGAPLTEALGQAEDPDCPCGTYGLRQRGTRPRHR